MPKLWPIERILFEANQVATKHWEKPITLNNLADVRYWLRSSINPKDKPPRLFLDGK